AERRPAGQKVLVLREGQRTEMNPELVLTIPDTVAEHGARTERRALARQKAAIAPAEEHPVADELLDPRRHAEEVLEDVHQPFGIPHLADERADVEELRQVRQRVALAQRRRGHADERADIDREAIVLRPIAIDVRLCLRPRAIEQREKAVMKDVEKAAEGRVA